MIRPIISSILLSFVLTPVAWSGEALNFEDETTRINYSLGYQIGGDFKRQNLQMNADAVVQGIRDALEGNQPQMQPPEMHRALRDLKGKVVAKQQTKKHMREKELIDAGKKFMEENAKQEGVVTTASGLQYKVITEGSGASPGPTDKVTVHYRGTRVDGKEFDSSIKRGEPASFQLNGVIKGWTEGLQLMKEGGKSQLIVPSDLAYGRRGPLAHQVLIFDVELLAVEEEKTKPETAAKAAQ
jgi:FKBP-type peptidyl-prolyl cis-trans isomerase FklB